MSLSEAKQQAIGLLEEEGVVATRQGSGTFVRQRPFAYGPGPLRSLAREIAAAGGDLETTVTSASPGRAPEGVAQRLGASAGEDVFVLERLRILEDFASNENSSEVMLML